MIKIAVIGPESTGKTALTQQLSEKYRAPWIPEYARGYVENLQQAYTYEDVCAIAQHQLEVENTLSLRFPEASFVFFDTELIITKVWFEYCYNNVPAFVSEHMKQHSMDFYLLCFPDLAWEPDAVREHGTDRDFFFEWYRREIEQTGKPYVIVNGTGPDRLHNATAAVESYIRNTTNNV